MSRKLVIRLLSGPRPKVSYGLSDFALSKWAGLWGGEDPAGVFL